MKKIITTLFLSAVVFAGAFLFLYEKRFAEPKESLSGEANRPILQDKDTQSAEPEKDARNLESKTDEQAGVAVTVAPDISSRSSEWKFDILMNTHSVELNQDMMEIAVLIDDEGKDHKPINWEGAPAGGHHREGVLVFDPITPRPKSIRLKISGIGGVSRNFEWQF